MDSKAPIACSLSGDDYKQRLAAIQEVGRRALLGVEDLSNGATLTFRNAPDVRDELATVVEAESTCCSFLDISLAEDGPQLMVSVAGPDEALPIVRDLTASFKGSGEAS